MINTNTIENIAKQLSENLPQSVKSAKDELSAHFEAALKDIFSKLQLVTREEFEAQQKVLARTRQILTDLEQKVSHLENDKK